MAGVIEVRSYRAKQGMREELLKLLHSRAFPLHRTLGMKVLGPFPTREDDVGFVWLRGFPDEASRDSLKAAFYEGPDWLDGLEAQILPMLDEYSAIVVEDTVDLWSNWPEETTEADATARPLTNFALTLVRGTSWDENVGIREQQLWDEHATFMDGLVETGFILFGGPVGDHRQTLHVVAGADEGEVR